VDAAIENEGDGWAGSAANPWHLDNNTEAILFLTDEGDKLACGTLDGTPNLSESFH
jgi:hypothetical protein